MRLDGKEKEGDGRVLGREGEKRKREEKRIGSVKGKMGGRRRENIGFSVLIPKMLKI